MRIRRDPDSTDNYEAAPEAGVSAAGIFAPVVTSTTTPAELTYPGGAVEELIDWIVSSSSRPSRVLALSAVLPFLGALLGRRFAGPTDLRSNLYVAALAPSGFGKDHARSQLKRLITAADLDAFSGPNRFMSGTAVRSTVKDKPSCFCMIDEIGGMLRQITDQRAGIHNLLIKSDLLEIFSAASTYFDGSAYAATKAVKIHNPNLCIYGTSTPEDFWAPLSSMNKTDGLLARIILFIEEGPKPARVVPTQPVRDVPAALVKVCQALAAAARRPGDISSNPKLDNGDTAVVPIIVPFDDDATKELEDFNQFIEVQQLSATPEAEPVLNRAAEHAQKLALIVTVANDPANPVTTGAIMSWAINLAWHSTCCMIEEANLRISDNLREANMNRISRLIKRAGEEGITMGQIADRTRSIERRQREELIHDLSIARRIEGRIKNDTGGRPSNRYFSVD